MHNIQRLTVYHYELFQNIDELRPHLRHVVTNGGFFILSSEIVQRDLFNYRHDGFAESGNIKQTE